MASMRRLRRYDSNAGAAPRTARSRNQATSVRTMRHRMESLMKAVLRRDRDRATGRGWSPGFSRACEPAKAGTPTHYLQAVALALPVERAGVDAEHTCRLFERGGGRQDAANVLGFQFFQR